MKLGVDTYSLRWQGWDAFQLLEYAAKLGLQNIHYSERQNLASHEEDYLKSLRRRGEDLGVSIEIGMLSFDQYASFYNASLGSGEQQLIDMIKAAKIVGSPIVRCVLGGRRERLGAVSWEQHVEESLRVLKIVAPVARDAGIKIAVENHGGVDFLARELAAFIEEAGTDFVGACLDTGNPAWGGENPVVSAEVLAPYMISSHIRDSRVWAVPEGAMAQWVPAGEGNTDLRRIVDIIAEKAPNAPVDLEVISGSGPNLVAYNDPESDFWKMYPNMLARDFVRYVALANSCPPAKSQPLQQPLPPAGTRVLPTGELGEQLRTEQLRQFEQSVKYFQNVLGVGK